MESVVRLTLAGLGGSMLGLSQERKLESMRVVTGATAPAAARRKRAPSSAQLAGANLNAGRSGNLSARWHRGHADGMLITVVGDVPAVTVKPIGNAVSPVSP